MFDEEADGQATIYIGRKFQEIQEHMNANSGTRLANKELKTPR